MDFNLNSFTHLRLGLERDEFELGVECEEELVDGGLAGVPLAHAADHDAAAVLGAVRQDDVQLLLVHPAQRHLTLDKIRMRSHLKIQTSRLIITSVDCFLPCPAW